MADPLVSVIMPAFNCQPFIAQALSSVCCDPGDLEVVVVDDGSTDETATVVMGFGDPRVRLIRQSNQGHSAATNAGVRAARGKYIKLVDADDVLGPGHLQAQLQVLQGAAEQVASCRWGYFIQDPATVQPETEHVQRDFADPLDWLICSLTEDQGMMGGWMWLTPRSVWDRAGGYNPKLGLNNDFDFSIRLLLASRGVRFAPQAVYCYRKGISAALSQSRGRKAMTSALLTTLLGCQSLLDREDSARIRRICADRLQMWLYEFFPEFPDLAAQAEQRIAELGGSYRPIQGGLLLKCLVPVLGWKLARRLQVAVRRIGWRRIERWKQIRSLGRFK
ncbi:MAG: glycosyltransferase family 2 protein [Planctomyces sp.]|jgi:glycosyltransferase involved in cell wall biosynthesis